MRYWASAGSWQASALSRSSETARCSSLRKAIPQMPARYRYRLSQFFVAMTARLTSAERALVANVLSPAELRLFERMPRHDQRHCLDVYRLLLRGGYADPLLLRAA